MTTTGWIEDVITDLHRAAVRAGLTGTAELLREARLAAQLERAGPQPASPAQPLLGRD